MRLVLFAALIALEGCSIGGGGEKASDRKPTVIFETRETLCPPRFPEIHCTTPEGVTTLREFGLAARCYCEEVNLWRLARERCERRGGQPSENTLLSGIFDGDDSEGERNPFRTPYKCEALPAPGAREGQTDGPGEAREGPGRLLGFDGLFGE